MRLVVNSANVAMLQDHRASLSMHRDYTRQMQRLTPRTVTSRSNVSVNTTPLVKISQVHGTAALIDAACLKRA